MIKTICWIQHTQKREGKNNNGKDGKVWYILINNSIYEKTMENVRNSANKEVFDFSNYSTKWKHYDNSIKLVIRKMKDKTAGVTIKTCWIKA